MNSHKDFEKEVIKLGNQHSLTLTVSIDEDVDELGYGDIILYHEEYEIFHTFKLSGESWEYVFERIGEHLHYYLDKLKNSVTRLEVIDENGRSYSKWNIEKIEYSIQDNGKTLKIFLK